MLDDENIVTYLCPVLGKPHAEEYDKRCPTELKQPRRKTLPISFIGVMPFITYNPFGGSDPMVIQMLAKKHEFMPNFIAEQGGYDVMVRRVRYKTLLGGKLFMYVNHIISI